MMISQKIANIILVILMAMTPLFSQRSLTRANIGMEYGIWKPSSLDDYPSQPLKNVAGADPYWGLTLTTPVIQSHSIRISIMQWRQEGLEEVGLEAATLRHLAVDLKYYVLPDYTVSPYVSYGLAAIWSQEEPQNNTHERIPPDRAGWGFDLGAGIDFMLYRHLGLGVEYQYLYAVFAKRVGMTTNYSGPKISFKFFFIF